MTGYSVRLFIKQKVRILPLYLFVDIFLLSVGRSTVDFSKVVCWSVYHVVPSLTVFHLLL